MRSVMITVLLLLATPQLFAQEKTHQVFRCVELTCDWQTVEGPDPTTAFPGTIDWKPIIFLVTGQAADGGTTIYKIAHGCGETNTNVYTANPTSGRIWLAKAATTSAVAFNMAILQKTGHPKLAKWFGVFGGSVGFGAAAYNLTVSCR